MFDIITHFNKTFDSNTARNILIIYREEKMFIGDSFILINKLTSCSNLFPQASIDINCSNKEHTSLCRALLKNNPFINAFSDAAWENLDYCAYDIVFCILPDEDFLLQVLINKYPQTQTWKTAIYSMSALFINTNQTPVLNVIFPASTEITDRINATSEVLPMELYVNEAEKTWANNWLKDQGLKEHEHLFIIQDSTSERLKMLNMDTYNAILCHLLDQDAVKVLIFDEQGLGKESFYRALLGEEKMSKIIFAKKLGLRNDICLLAADYTRLILGPCTGMLHCAEGIYNYFVRSGKDIATVPSIITYTGKYLDENDTAFRWWGTAPLVNCLILRSTADHGQEVVLLNDIPEEEKKDVSRLLPCNDYTPDLLIKFLPAQQHAIII